MKQLTCIWLGFFCALTHGEQNPPPAMEDTTNAAITDMIRAANNFSTSLRNDQKQKAHMEMSDENREAFKFTPGARRGVPLEDLDEDQTAAAKDLLATALSQRGMMKASTIMQLEQLLAEIENNPKFRNSKAYYTSIFGKPTAGSTWAWRFEGHHISVNMTIIEGKSISASPTFMGASPAKVKEGRMKGTHVLEKEESIARALASSLQKAGKPVIYSTKAPQEILSAEARKINQFEPVGVKASDMDDLQWKVLLELVKEYAERHRNAIAKKEIETFEAHARERIYFAWAGSPLVGEAYYYRVQTPTILIEAANSQNQANHMHSVWRDAKADFGRDSLGDHYHEHKH
jgi:hypothetical protein